MSKCEAELDAQVSSSILEISDILKSQFQSITLLSVHGIENKQFINNSSVSPPKKFELLWVAV